MKNWYWWALGGMVLGLGAFFYLFNNKKPGGAPDQLAAARQARLDKLANEKAATDEPGPEAAS